MDGRRATATNVYDLKKMEKALEEAKVLEADSYKPGSSKKFEVQAALATEEYVNLEVALKSIPPEDVGEYPGAVKDCGEARAPVSETSAKEDDDAATSGSKSKEIKELLVQNLFAEMDEMNKNKESQKFSDAQTVVKASSAKKRTMKAPNEGLMKLFTDMEASKQGTVGPSSSGLNTALEDPLISKTEENPFNKDPSYYM